MPFGEIFFGDEEHDIPLIQSDLLESLEAEMDQEDIYGNGDASAGPTVVTLADRSAVNDVLPDAPEADLELQLQTEIQDSLPVSAPASVPKKRGRPSLSASATPAKSVAARTPRSAKSAATPKSASRSAGKRKAVAPEPEPEKEEEEEEVEEEAEADGEAEESGEDEMEDVPAVPARKRGRPARSTSAPTSARIAAKAAKKPTRGSKKPAAVSMSMKEEYVFVIANHRSRPPQNQLRK
ncbi:hypothetical protein B0J18DRAFT_10800 [Chaetomium sp. MPI-SDFR-AT-0129]|nr:hypothetical protein B0J18DRAFT_10800 [Chaetomium sp. MPI-SDFR-AT-0129]